MAQTIKLKRTNVPGRIPTSGQLDVGEIALNMADSLLFFKDHNGDVKEITVSNVLKLDQSEEYLPTEAYHPATKTYVDLKVLQSIVSLTTIEKTEIIDDAIVLPKMALGDITNNMAMIWDSEDAPYFVEVSCQLSEDRTRLLFDPLDNLNGKFCVITYLTFANL